jgi:hypothetical protein
LNQVLPPIHMKNALLGVIKAIFSGSASSKNISGKLEM